MTLKRAARLLADKIGDHSRQLEEVRLKLKDNANNLTEFKASMVAEYQSRQNDLKSLFEVFFCVKRISWVKPEKSTIS